MNGKLGEHAEGRQGKCQAEEREAVGPENQLYQYGQGCILERDRPAPGSFIDMQTWTKDLHFLNPTLFIY